MVIQSDMKVDPRSGAIFPYNRFGLAIVVASDVGIDDGVVRRIRRDFVRQHEYLSPARPNDGKPHMLIRPTPAKRKWWPARSCREFQTRVCLRPTDMGAAMPALFTR